MKYNNTYAEIITIQLEEFSQNGFCLEISITQNL